MSPPTHLFIVGAARSGTNLARNLLNSSPHCTICGELRFFDHGRFRLTYRQELRLAGDLSTDEGARRVIAQIYDDAAPKGFWRWVQRNVEREEFTRRLLGSDRTERALLDLVVELYADGRPIRGEKTPAHVKAVPTLLAWFPRARVVHMIRDPRAVYVSARITRFDGSWDTPVYRRLRRSWPALSLHLSRAIASSWLHCAQIDRRYRRTYAGRYVPVKFEDLVTEPGRTAEKLCQGMGVQFDEAMLQQRVRSSSFATGETAVVGFDVTAVDRWRGLLHPLLNRWLLIRCGARMRECGYDA